MIYNTLAMQAEVAKDLLSTTDATIIGVLLAFIVILLTAIVMLWKKIQKNEDYIREQDKANLDMLAAMTRNAEMLGADISKVKDYTIDAKPVINQTLEIIKNRLKLV